MELWDTEGRHANQAQWTKRLEVQYTYCTVQYFVADTKANFYTRKALYV